MPEKNRPRPDFSAGLTHFPERPQRVPAGFVLCERANSVGFAGLEETQSGPPGGKAVVHRSRPGSKTMNLPHSSSPPRAETAQTGKGLVQWLLSKPLRGAGP